MNRLFLVLLVSLSVAATTTAPTSAPTSAPTTAPAIEMLDQGRVRITPPAGWTLLGRTNDGLSLRYKLGEGEGVMSIIVNPQTAPIQGDAAVSKMGLLIGKQLREAAIHENAKILSPARVIPDERFLLKVHDRTRGNDGKVRDQVQIYRSMGLELLHVATVALADNDESAKPIHAAGELVADMARLGSGPKPSSFRRARVKLMIPPDWIEQRKDDPNGVVAIYTNRAKPGARLVVRSRIIPKNQTTNKEVRRNALDMVVDDYRNEAIPAGATAVGEEQVMDNAGLAKSVARDVDWNGKPWQTTFRCRSIGDVAVGVEALVPAGEEEVAQAAEQMAQSIRSLDDQRPVQDVTLSPAAQHVAQRRAATMASTTRPAPADSTRTQDTPAIPP